MMSLECWFREDEVVQVFSELTCFSDLHSWYDSRECLLVLESGIIGRVRQSKVGGDFHSTLGIVSERKGR